MEIKVRLNETDLLGHINNVSYFTYLEMSRIEFLQDAGLEVGNKEFAFLLASTKCDFIQQGYYGQILKVDTIVSRIGTKSLTVISNIYNKATGELIAKGEATLVYFDITKQESVAITDSIKNKLLPLTLK
ncbi:acyl-CoA thioesterase [Oceanobacillus sp. CAU 1775]